MPTLGLSMIAKNEAHTLASCLQSVVGLVSQIVVADTGSSDNTAQIARDRGARVVEVPWKNDFSAARNAALLELNTDWVLSLDADEELDSAAQESIPALLEARNVHGYLVPIRNYVPTSSGRGWDRATQPNDGRHPRAAAAPAYFVHENCRLFRRDPEIYFVGRVHELVEPRIAAKGLKLGMAEFFIHHFGQLAAEDSRKRKTEAYLAMLRLKVEESAGDPLAWVQLGLQEYESTRQSAQALRCLDRALEISPRMPQAWLFKAMILLDKGEDAAALSSLEKAKVDSSSHALRESLRGDALHNLGRLEEAREAYLKAVRLTGGDPVLQSKLGYTEVKTGRSHEGIARLESAVRAAPELVEIRERAMKAYVVLDQLPKAAEHAERSAEIEGTPKGYIRAISLYALCGQNQCAQRVLRRAWDRFPDAAELHRVAEELPGLPASQTR